MPIHDWTTRYAGTFHDFHQQWIAQLTSRLNGGRLPPGHFALTDHRVEGWEPDVAGRVAGTPGLNGPVPLPRLQLSHRSF